MNKRHKRTVCLFFQVHQPFRLKTYRFFNIGVDHTYYDEDQNKQILRRVAHDCYLPANEVLMKLIRKHGPDFKVSFCISGTALEQFRKYTPWIIESFRQLYETGNVEFLAESCAHSMAVLVNPSEYMRQVEEHVKTLESCFGCKPTALVNANLLFSNEIAGVAHAMGFKTILTEGASQTLGWKSSNYVYSSEIYPELKLLLRNYRLSDDITFRFSVREWSGWPLTADKYISWLNAIDQKEDIVNLFMDYATLGEYQKAESGIFSFFNAFTEKIIDSQKWTLKTVTEAAESIVPIATLTMPEYISCADQDHDLSAWLGNELQQEAFNSLYSVAYIMGYCKDKELLSDWKRLQSCDHFYYMCTKYMNDGAMHRFFSPYSSPFDAFINYMSVLSDFLIRVHEYADHHVLSSTLHNELELRYLETI